MLNKSNDLLPHVMFRYKPVLDELRKYTKEVFMVLFITARLNLSPFSASRLIRIQTASKVLFKAEALNLMDLSFSLLM